MIKFYYSMAPNPRKVALFLEEANLPYDPILIDVRRAEQHDPAFLAINPNAKVPAILDGATRVFDSSAILLYLAEKTGLFLPPACLRAEMLSWLMFTASGLGPFSGQSIHFKRYAPMDVPYARNRYDFEARRHWRLIEEQLAGKEWMLGDRYTLLDMAVWGWARSAPMALGDDAWQDLPNLKRFVERVDARPAARRALALQDRHAFKTEMDDVAKQSMFPQNLQLTQAELAAARR